MSDSPTPNLVEPYPTPVLLRAVDVIVRRGFSEKLVSVHRILGPLQRAFEPVLLECRPAPGDRGAISRRPRFSDSPVIEMQMRLVESALCLRCYVLGLVFCDYLIGPLAPSGGGSRLLQISHVN